jgi:hypothetical protein
MEAHAWARAKTLAAIARHTSPHRLIIERLFKFPAPERKARRVSVKRRPEVAAKAALDG